MKNRPIIITAFLLMFAIGNCSRVISKSNIRLIDFLSIFAFGLLAGALLIQIVKRKQDKA